MKKMMFFTKQIFDLANIKSYGGFGAYSVHAPAASTHTQCTFQRLQRILNACPSSLGAYSVQAPAALAYT